MARNRKYKSAVVRFGPALKAFVLCLLIGGSGVGYVWQKNQIYQLGQQIKKRELRLSELKDQNGRLRKDLGIMRSPSALEKRSAISIDILDSPRSTEPQKFRDTFAFWASFS